MIGHIIVWSFILILAGMAGVTIGSLLLAAIHLLVGKVPLRYSYRNLTMRWKTTLLTALAFTLVVGLLTVMVAFVNGMNRLTEGSGIPGNVIVLSRGATDEVFSSLPSEDILEMENQPGVVRENGKRLASRETYFVVNQFIKEAPPGRPSRRFLQVRGIVDPLIASRVHRLSLFPGSLWFSEAGVQDATRENGKKGLSHIQVVLGEGIARELGRDRNAEALARAKKPDRLDLGDTFELAGRTMVVVGIMESAGATFDSEVWARQSVVGPLLGKTTYSSVVLRTQDAQAAEKLKLFLNGGDQTGEGKKSKFPDRFKAGFQKSNIQAEVETLYFASLANTTKQFAYAIGFVTVVLGVGGVFGVMNTMFAAVNQRKKDLGVLRLLGYHRWHLLASLMFESLMIALIGGLLGCGLGSLADGWQANSIVGSDAGGGKFVVLKLVVDSTTLGWGMLATVIMGSLGGFLPAVSTLRLKALDTLR